MKQVLLNAVAVTVLAGCATTGHKVADTSSLSTLKPGVTTLADVKAVFGQPIQDTKEPDGTDKLQYMSKVRERDQDVPIVGSNIPRQIEKNVSSFLVFDQNGRFVHAWTSDKTVDENVPGNLGKFQANDIIKGSMYSNSP